MRIVWSPQALQDLASAREFIAQDDPALPAAVLAEREHTPRAASERED